MSIRFYFLSILFAALGTCFCGCSSAPADPQRLATIQSIFVKPIVEPQIKVVRGTTEWSPLGTEASLHQILAQKGLHLGAETHDALAAALAQDRYQVASDAISANAVLESDVEMADYVSGMPIFGGGCTPIVLFNVHLTDAKTDAALFSRTYRFQSGGGTGITGHVLLDAGPKYDIDDCATLWSNPNIAMEAFRTAVADVANAVQADLRKP